MSFIYNKNDALCKWCKRTKNPHLDFTFEKIPTKYLNYSAITVDPINTKADFSDDGIVNIIDIFAFAAMLSEGQFDN